MCETRVAPQDRELESTPNNCDPMAGRNLDDVDTSYMRRAWKLSYIEIHIIISKKEKVNSRGVALAPSTRPCAACCGPRKNIGLYTYFIFNLDFKIAKFIDVTA